jgi:hypothetical protein
MNHSGDALSALLDGQLSAAEATAVRAHVDECASCAQELDDVREARRLVRSLPAVDPPFDLLAANVVSLAPRRRRAPALAAASVAVAATIALALLAPWQTTSDTLDPDLDVAMDQHASTMGALEAEGVIAKGPARLQSEDEEEVPPTTARRQALSDVDDDFETPERLAGYALVDAYEVGNGVHLLYQRGAYGLSVFERAGEIDWDELPEGGTSIVLSGHRAWRWDDVVADGRLVVIEGDGVVITIAGDEPGDAVLDAAVAISREL